MNCGTGSPAATTVPRSSARNNEPAGRWPGPTESAIKVHGYEDGSARITLDIHPEDLDQLKGLFNFRGRELLLVIQEA